MNIDNIIIRKNTFIPVRDVVNPKLIPGTHWWEHTDLLACFWKLGGIQSTWRKAAETRGKHSKLHMNSYLS